MKGGKMPHPAGALGRAKQHELKPMMTEEALGRHNGRDLLIAEIAKLASSVHFHLTDETLWAYRLIERFLHDGWEGLQFEVDIRIDSIISAGEFGRAMGALVGGTCFDQSAAIQSGAPWTQAGPYPSRADLGAFLFYCFMAP